MNRQTLSMIIIIIILREKWRKLDFNFFQKYFGSAPSSTFSSCPCCSIVQLICGVEWSSIPGNWPRIFILFYFKYTYNDFCQVLLRFASKVIHTVTVPILVLSSEHQTIHKFRGIITHCSLWIVVKNLSMNFIYFLDLSQLEN